MSNTSKILLPIFIAIVGILSFLLHIQDEKLEIADKLRYMDSLTMERKDRLIQKQDSLIHFLNEIKITKVTIIEKDTVR